MRDVIEAIDRLMARSAAVNTELAGRYGVPVDSVPIGGLNATYNHLVMTRELLGFYLTAWSPGSEYLDRVDDPEQTRQENGKRLTTASKSAFLLSLFAYEAQAVEAMELFPGKILPPFEDKAYLSGVIERAAKHDLIPQSDLDPWLGLIDVRNKSVHTNAVADKDRVYDVPGGPRIEMKRGEMMQADLMFFPSLIGWSIEAYGRLCEGFLRP